MPSTKTAKVVKKAPAVRLAAKEALDVLHQAFALLGYDEGPPSDLPASMFDDERETWALVRCGFCRKRGLALFAWNRRREYRCVVVCPKCGACEEA